MLIKHAWCKLQHQVPAWHQSGCRVQRVLHFEGWCWQRRSCNRAAHRNNAHFMPSSYVIMFNVTNLGQNFLRRLYLTCNIAFVREKKIHRMQPCTFFKRVCSFYSNGSWNVLSYNKTILFNFFLFFFSFSGILYQNIIPCSFQQMALCFYTSSTPARL